MNTCSECDKPRKSRGLCATHYNRKYQPNRHAKRTLKCDACGGPAIKYAGAQRWNATYCSQLCRDYARWGGSSCTLPASHWARMYGATSEWRPPLSQRACDWCGEKYQPLRENARFCSRRCHKAKYRVNRRGREHAAIGSYNWTDVVKLWALFDKSCAYCRKPLALTDVQAEHVVPISRGGANNIGNLLPSCMPCNADKRDLSLSQWAQHRQQRGLDEVVTTWSRTDSRYAHLTVDATAAPLAA